MSTVDHPIMLIVLDGWGHSDDTEFNAIHSAHKPTWDHLLTKYPHSLISCSGNDVGLPDQQMGNSEVGHMHIGAGRTVNQDFTRISSAIDAGDFFENPTLQPAFERVAKVNKAVHILGLLSPGGVHSHEQHMIALLDLAQQTKVRQVYLHAFLDGRDTPPRSASTSIRHLQQKCNELGIGRIVSMVGRYYAMDRNKNWDRTQAAYELIASGRGRYDATDPELALDEAYKRGEGDEFMHPTAIVSDHPGRTEVENGDVVVFANFRSDRARQLTMAFTDPGFSKFKRKPKLALDSFITMTSYSADFDVPVAFPQNILSNTYGDWVSGQGLRQLRIAETEKYAHVTFFFNGGTEKQSAGEDRVMVPSPDVATYDLKPEMSAEELTAKLAEALRTSTYDTIICNYANADMVGHTGNFEATIRSIETLDTCLAKIVLVAQEYGMEILITADHGNAEKMRSNDSPNAQVHTAHTSNLVPLIYIGRQAEISPNGCLSDLAPTMLSLMGLDIPMEMTGKPLVTLMHNRS